MYHARNEHDDDPCSDMVEKSFVNAEKGMGQSQGLHCLIIESNFNKNVVYNLLSDLLKIGSVIRFNDLI